MDANVVGINEQKIDKLVINVNNYVERIINVLNNMEDLVNSTEVFFQEEIGNEFRSNFKQLSSNFPIVKTNILSYSHDMIQVKLNYQKTMITIAENFKYNKEDK